MSRAAIGLVCAILDRPLERILVGLTHNLSVVMPGLVPGTHVFRATKQGVGGRDKPGHDELGDST
jgi:hypothetical protein